MKKHGNTLYVTTQGAYLSREGTTVHVRIEKETKLRLPIHTISGIVCFGNVSCSPFLLGLCGSEGVGVSLLTTNGRFLARVEGPRSGNVLLRRAQHRATADETLSARPAAVFVTAKIANARNNLQRVLRDHEDKIDAIRVEVASRRLAFILRQLAGKLPLEQVRGLEGDAAKTYFDVFDQLILAQKDAFVFKGRSKRPPRDPVNALLSFLYTLLAHDVASACESTGLDPQMGFLHRDRPGRPSLALDLMEELRPQFADRLALSLINRRQVSAKGFSVQESGAVQMDDATRKAVLNAYQNRKSETIEHPFLGEKVTLGLLPFVQARLLARWLRTDLDDYPAFFWK